MNPYSSSLMLDELLPKKKQTCPHKWSNRLLFDAMLYQLKNGCHWAELPKEFPPYSTVYWHYKQWRALGVIDKLMVRLHESQRRRLKKPIHKPDYG